MKFTHGLRMIVAAAAVLLALLGGISSSVVAAAQDWTLTGSMSTPRIYHTATALATGKVLVVGGYTGYDYSAAAELYDPATRTWTATGSMSSARMNHTATLLANGKVLVTGGANGVGFNATAELYDPATGTWTGAGSMRAPRSSHSATLLANGKVLVTGGSDGRVVSVVAELYDPVTGTWTAKGDLSSPRYLHTATLLANGKVLVAGGWTGSGLSAAAELFTGAPADTTPPVIVPTVSGTLGANGWYTSNVQVTWTVTDPESAITASTGCGPTMITADTAGITLTCSATSAGGTTSKSVTIKRDATPPSVTTSQSPAANANGWNDSDVTVSASGTDALSGIASCTSTKVTTEGAALSATVSCTDNAGNTTSAIRSGIKIDKTVPSATAVPSRGADQNGWFNHAFSATWRGADSLSGIASCSPVSTYSGPDTASGSLSGTCTDKAGNSAGVAYVFKYDATAPVTIAVADLSPNAQGTGNYDVQGTVTLQATDNLSGVASTEYNLDGAGWVAYTGAILVPGQGGNVHVVEYRSRDKAGNVEAIKRLTLDQNQGNQKIGAGSGGSQDQRSNGS